MSPREEVPAAGNPFAPPAAVLTEAQEPLDPSALPRPAALQRLVLLTLGFLMPVILWMILAMAGAALGSRYPPHQGTAIVGAFGTVAPLLVFLVYLPYALARMHRTSATLPMRILGCRFVRPDGGRAGLLRIVVLWWLPGFLLLVGPMLAGLLFLSRPTAVLGSLVAGPLLHLADTLTSHRASRRTLRDQLAGLVMVRP